MIKAHSVTDKIRKTTQKEFGQFKRTFTKYQNLFGLNGYEIYFKLQPVDYAFATISVNQEEMTATITLASEIQESDIPFIDVDKSAKHEATHLLLARLSYLIHKREYLQSEAIGAEEEVVNKILNVLNQLNL